MNNANRKEVITLCNIVDKNNEPTDYYVETNPDGTLKLYSLYEFYNLLNKLHDDFNKKEIETTK